MGLLAAGALVGGRRVADDEQLLARFDQTEIAPCHFLECVRIRIDSFDLRSQPGVFRACRRDPLIERLRLLTLLQHLQDTLVADQRVDDEDAPGEDEQVLHRPAPAAPRNQSDG